MQITACSRWTQAALQHHQHCIALLTQRQLDVTAALKHKCGTLAYSLSISRSPVVKRDRPVEAQLTKSRRRYAQRPMCSSDCTAVMLLCNIAENKISEADVAQGQSAMPHILRYPVADGDCTIPGGVCLPP